MLYSKFSISDLCKKLGLQIERNKIFDNIEPLTISDWLKETLQMSNRISLLSENNAS